MLAYAQSEPLEAPCPTTQPGPLGPVSYAGGTATRLDRRSRQARASHPSVPRPSRSSRHGRLTPQPAGRSPVHTRDLAALLAVCALRSRSVDHRYTLAVRRVAASANLAAAQIAGPIHHTLVCLLPKGQRFIEARSTRVEDLGASREHVTIRITRKRGGRRDI